jgi:hypothetical protein
MKFKDVSPQFVQILSGEAGPFDCSLHCLTIAEVAYQVGFSDQSYFDRRFKAAFGRTPRDFRLLREQLNGSSKGPRRPSRRIGAITDPPPREQVLAAGILKNNPQRLRSLRRPVEKSHHHMSK